MKKTIIIAEAGVNHNGSIELAKQLIDCAAEAGADFVKFQTFKADQLTTSNAEKAEYQMKDNSNENQYQMLKRLELSEDDHSVLFEYCRMKGIAFLSTPFSIEAAHFLNEFVPFFKVSSSDLNNVNFLCQLAKMKKPIVLSTGMSEMEEIQRSINLIKEKWNQIGVNYKEAFQSNLLLLPWLTVLHCSTAYPTPIEEVNLLAMNDIKMMANVEIGYSDHTQGTEVSIAAAALGAIIIEKHFTLDKNMSGPDHNASLDPMELKLLVSGIRNIDLALGDGRKRIMPSESKNIKIARKGLYYSKNLDSGDTIMEDDILTMRPIQELSASSFFEVAGRKLNKKVSKGTAIKLSDLK